MNLLKPICQNVLVCNKSISFKMLITFGCLFTVSFYSFADDLNGIKLDKINLFESGSNFPDKTDRTYTSAFSPDSRYIVIELNIENLKYNTSEQQFDVIFIWKYMNGEELGRNEAKFNVKSEWKTAYINRGWGWPEKGNWRVGRYTAQVYVNGELFGEKEYFVDINAEDFKDLSIVNEETKALSNIPLDFSYRALQLYKIDSYFNGFYKIQFSEDGKDIAYCLSQYEKIGGYETETIVRNVYLFKNNKQIVPVYFRIDPEFDKDLKNLYFKGVRVIDNKLNFYHYFNGRYLGHSIDFRSPDNQKFAYIENTMPLLRSSFTWDDAYEYLVINDNKIQPEFLSAAKVINIVTPVVYIKNQDNTYNALYTVRFRIEKDNCFALLNEDKRISPEYNGHISRPYVSDDEKSQAYFAENNKKFFVVLNNEKLSLEFDKIEGDIQFCESGKNVIYRAKMDGDWYVMKGNKKVSQGFSEIGAILINNDETKIIYQGKSGKKWSIYVNDKKNSGDFDFIDQEMTLYEKDFKIAYAACNNDVMFVMVNDKKVSPEFEKFPNPKMLAKVLEKKRLGLIDLTFNKTGNRVAYLHEISKTEGDLITHNEKYILMINDIQILPESYGSSLISIQSGKLIYAGIDVKDYTLNHLEIDF